MMLGCSESPWDEWRLDVSYYSETESSLENLPNVENGVDLVRIPCSSRFWSKLEFQQSMEELAEATQHYSTVQVCTICYSTIR